MSNVGEVGPESLRVGGKKVDELPIAEAANAAAQLPAVREANKTTIINNIRARYPDQSVAWCEGALREVQKNLQRVRQLSKDTQESIDEYMGLKTLCVKRDEKLMPLKAGRDDEEIKAIKKEYPPYVVKAMKTQIGQFKATINRCNDVIDQEIEQNGKLTALKAQCTERDTRLKEQGITI